MSGNTRTLGSFVSSLAPTGKAAEETLHAIILGQADALVIETPDGPRVYTLRDAAEPYRELVERMSDAALVIDADHTILYCNGGLARMLGRPGQAGNDLLSLVAPHQRSLARELLEAGAKSQASAELRLIAANGAEVPVRASAAPLSFDGLPCVALVVTALDDIESLKVSAANLRQSEERYRNLVEQAQDGILLADADGRFVDVNPAGHTMLGYTRDEFLKLTIADLHVPEEMDRLSLVLAELLGGKTTRSEWRYRRKDGSEFTGEIASRHFSDGHFLGILRDVTERKRTEETLRASDAYSRSVFESSPDCIKVISLDGRLLEMNGNGRCKMEIEDFKSFRGRFWPDLWPPEARVAIEAALAEARAGRTGHFSGFCPTMKGVPKWWDVMVTAIPGADGSPSRFIASSRDVTERKQAEETLRKNGALMRLAADAARMTYAEFDFNKGRLHLAENFAGVMGYTPPPLSAETSLAQVIANLLAHIAPEDRVRVDAANRGFLAGNFDGSVFYRVIGDDGLERWIESRWTAEADKNGRPSRGIAAMLDITERKRAELALQESDERLRLALNGAKAAAWQWNILTSELIWSRECYQLYGRDPAHDLARYELWRDCLHPDDLPPTERLLRAVMERSLPEYRTEYRVILPNGDLRWLAALGRMDYGADGTPLRLSGINLDITEQKQAELQLSAAKAEAERANQAKSKFLAAASHDLRQPVQSMVLLLSLLSRQTADQPKASVAVKMMQSAVDGLSGLLSGILDISRLDAGVVAPEIQAVNVGDLIAQLCSEYSERTTSASLRLLVAPRPLWARTDPVLLQRALRNLLENALRYTRTGGVLVGARKRGDRVRIDVVDTGIGVAPDQQREIFEEFFQADNPGRAPGEGLGLGLAIVSRLAKLLGVEVDMRSNPGRGSRFSLLLPMAGEIQPPGPALAPADAPVGRLLVIEDNAVVRQGLVALLADWGCQPMPVASGEEAIEWAAKEGNAFDAIVADYRLGAGLTGIAAAREIARQAGRKIPTLVLTGDTGKQQITEIETSGFAILHKPVDAENLQRALARLINEK